MEYLCSKHYVKQFWEYGEEGTQFMTTKDISIHGSEGHVQLRTARVGVLSALEDT